MPAVRTLFALLVCASVGLGAEAVKLRTLANKTLQGELVGVTDKEVVIKTGDGPLTVAVSQVLELDMQAAAATLPAKYYDIELIDGSLLHCTEYSLKGSRMELKLAGGHEVKFPLETVSYVLGDAQDAKVREEWQGLLTKRGNHDLIAIKKNDVVNAVGGTFGEGDAKGQTIGFETESGSKYRPKLTDIHGMSFLRKADVDAPLTQCKVYDTSRNVLVASKLSLGPKAFVITTVAGVKVEYPRSLIARLDYSKGKLTYLSAMTPVKVIEKSASERIEHYRTDVNLDGGPIQLPMDKTTKYDRGLAVHAYTELVYDIGGQYKEFTAVLGVDPMVGGDSDVKVTVMGDGKRLFSGEVKRKDEARPIKLDVKNVRLLRIVVSSANPLDLDLGDHVNIADAKVSK